MNENGKLSRWNKIGTNRIQVHVVQYFAVCMTIELKSAMQIDIRTCASEQWWYKDAQMHLCIYAFIEVHFYLPTKDKKCANNDKLYGLWWAISMSVLIPQLQMNIKLWKVWLW